MENDTHFLQEAIKYSRQSFKEGNFPAGAVVVKDGQIAATAVSSPYPGLFHADSKAISEAFQKSGILTGCTLYVGLQPCLMCSGVIYWSGLRRVVYAIPKEKVSPSYYETHSEITKLIQTFNETITLIHDALLEEEALSVVREWERKHDH
ncbi:MAG TPA: nucleoside deaminase [Candidatus Saccharimonadia bacterium]|nr:nucleoside deaminase [Candidatus Saccharimonadia bacterium]